MSLGIEYFINQMSLPIEYFIKQKHITDLEKLKDKELYFIIRLFRDELEKFNESEEFKLKGLIKVCNEMKDLIKNFRFILNGYIEVINHIIRCIEEKDGEEILRMIQNNKFFCFKREDDTEEVLKREKDNYTTFIEEIEQLLTEMDKIENILDKIKAVRLLKEKVDELANKCLYKMRILYDSLNDFIVGEIYFWENTDLKNRIHN